MKTTTRKMRSPLKWHGGKSYLARRIVALMPEHRVYVEPFLGGGSVLLNKPKSEVEIAGDLDLELVLFWNRFACDPERLSAAAAHVTYDETTFQGVRLLRNLRDPIHRSLDFLVLNRFSRGGLGKTFAWSDRLRGGQPGDANAWDTIRAAIPTISDRVRDVEFHCGEATCSIRHYDAPDALIYCDPPYLHSTRTARKAYAHEMSEAQHADLLRCLKRCQGHVLLSGYRSPLYDESLDGWDRVEFDMPNHSGQGKTKQRRVECLWSNRPLSTG